MPRHRRAKKDVASCDKPREGASDRRSADIRMGQPGSGNVESFSRSAGRKRTRGSETSNYPEEKKEKSIPLVAASEAGRA
jgi:hypothetical protein